VSLEIVAENFELVAGYAVQRLVWWGFAGFQLDMMVLRAMGTEYVGLGFREEFPLVLMTPR
jgi:hypothetical protein